MNLLQAAILAIVEGISEFLPISSTGHLILASNLLQVPQTEFVKSFEIYIQLGAILAVVWLYKNKLLANIRLWPKILAGFLPSAIIGFVFYPFIKQYLLGSTQIVSLSLLIGGLVLILIETKHKEKQGGLEHLTLKTALFIGLFQVISMIPGVSRAAATIIGGLLLGLNRESAVEFSFLLAVPTMLAASGLDLVKSNLLFSPNQWFLLAIGFVGAFITALLAIKFLLKFIKDHNFVSFGIYRILIGGIFLIFF